MEQTRKPGNIKTLLGAAAGIIAFAIAYYAVQHIFFNNSFDQEMVAAASEVNKSCPIMVDRETRLDNVVALPGNIFQYNYTLVNISKDQISSDTLRQSVEPQIINSVKTNPDLKPYRENKTTMAYNYKDKNGVFLLKITVTPDLYLDK